MKLFAVLLMTVAAVMAVTTNATLKTSLPAYTPLVPAGSEVIALNGFQTELFTLTNNTIVLSKNGTLPVQNAAAFAEGANLYVAYGLAASGLANIGLWSTPVATIGNVTLIDDLSEALVGQYYQRAAFMINNVTFAITQDEANQLVMVTTKTAEPIFNLQGQVSALAALMNPVNTTYGSLLAIMPSGKSNTTVYTCSIVAPNVTGIPVNFIDANAVSFCLPHTVNATFTRPVVVPVNATVVEIYDNGNQMTLNLETFAISKSTTATNDVNSIAYFANIPTGAIQNVWGLMTQNKEQMIFNVVPTKTAAISMGFKAHAKCVPSPWNLCR